MGYLTIDKFNIIFMERTKQNVKDFDNPNKFTHLINSLLGLMIDLVLKKTTNKTLKPTFN